VRRLALISVLGVLAAGCGGEETTSPRPETVEGEQPQTQPQAAGDPAAGKTVFTESGCGSCHTFAPAGSTGKTGPPLDDLEGLAEKADQGTVEEFTRSSIVTPNAYVEDGFPEGVMPAWTGDEKQLNDLVAFLTES
jgi:mono/diheme cytochrome c family protein